MFSISFSHSRIADTHSRQQNIYKKKKIIIQTVPTITATKGNEKTLHYGDSGGGLQLLRQESECSYNKHRIIPYSSDNSKNLKLIWCCVIFFFRFLLLVFIFNATDTFRHLIWKKRNIRWLKPKAINDPLTLNVVISMRTRERK